jgi:predicted nucleic acid-binding protein
LIVADSGPLIALARIGQLHLLRDLFRTVLIPQAVATECLAGENRPGSRAIAQALKQGWLKKQRLSARIQLLGRPAMGEGENAAITLAHRLRSRLLADDKAARKIASASGVPVVGTVGVLVEAKRRGLVRKVGPLIEDLKQGGYRLSNELVEQALIRCREVP